MTSSKALVASSTFSENLVVTLASSTLISKSLALPAGSSSAPLRRKLSRVFFRNLFLVGEIACASGVAANSLRRFQTPSLSGMPEKNALTLGCTLLKAARSSG